MRAQVTETDDFITIIARSTVEAMQQYKAQGLDRLGYSIMGRIGPHRFSLVEGSSNSELFAGESIVAATFSRSASR